VRDSVVIHRRRCGKTNCRAPAARACTTRRYSATRRVAEPGRLGMGLTSSLASWWRRRWGPSRGAHGGSHNPGLERRRHLVGAGRRLGAAVGESRDPVPLAAGQPVVQGLAGHSVAAGDVGDGGSVQDLEHCFCGAASASPIPPGPAATRPLAGCRACSRTSISRRGQRGPGAPGVRLPGAGAGPLLEPRIPDRRVPIMAEEARLVPRQATFALSSTGTQVMGAVALGCSNEPDWPLRTRSQVLEASLGP
jgi:hypothetical protein